jgi:hypothetical protein
MLIFAQVFKNFFTFYPRRELLPSSINPTTEQQPDRLESTLHHCGLRPILISSSHLCLVSHVVSFLKACRQNFYLFLISAVGTGCNMVILSSVPSYNFVFYPLSLEPYLTTFSIHMIVWRRIISWLSELERI